jgi:SAM-dependent methyltransferase
MSQPFTEPASSAPPVPRRALVRAYGRANAAWFRAGALLRAVHEGAWLGLLRRADLHEVDEHFYHGNAIYQGEAHNLRGLMPWEETALQEFGAGGRLLVLGAGGGREVLALSRRGYEVVGYECNEGLADFAARFLPAQGCDARIHHLPRDAAPPAAGGPFDGIILGWGAYTLMAGRAHRTDLLRRLRPLAKPGGLLLVSFYTRYDATSRFRVAAAVANGIRTVLLRERAELGDALSPNFVHYFTAQEIAAELREAGWEPRRFNPPGPPDSSWAVAVAPG